MADTPSYPHITTSFPHPPDGVNHPLWMAAVKNPKVKSTRSPGDPPPLIPGTRSVKLFHNRHTATTIARVAVGHVFTGDNSSRFHSALPDARPCGAPFRSVPHLLFDCPRFTTAHRENSFWYALLIDATCFHTMVR